MVVTFFNITGHSVGLSPFGFACSLRNRPHDTFPDQTVTEVTVFSLHQQSDLSPLLVMLTSWFDLNRICQVPI